MSNVKGNDIDDLFKRAADKYPLRTDSADWNKLAADLDKDRSLLLPPANAGGGDKRKRRRFFWLFLLLPLGGIGYYAVQSSRQSKAATAQHGVSQTPGTAAASGKGSNPEDTASAVNPAAGPTGKTPLTTGASSGTPATVGTASEKPAPAGTLSGTTNRVTPVSPATLHSADKNRDGTRKNQPNESAGKNHTGETNSQTNSSALGPHPPTEGSNPPTGSGLRGGETINRSLTKRPSTEGQITGKRRTKGPLTGQAGSDEEGKVSRTGDEVHSNGGQTMKVPDRDLSLSALKSRRARTTGGVALNVTVTAKNNPVAAKDSSGAKKRIPAKNKKEAFFYAGLIVAPDLSTVKMQSVKGVGTTYGVLLGYQFNKRWAVETGAYLDHKKYYTEGEYFKQKSNNNPNYKLLSVDGYCNMWEIPVNIRYNISSGQKTKWFATTGLSTYLMTRENYVSKIDANGWTYDSPWDIKKPSQYWFSVVNLSVGFEQKLGRIGNLRLEPYLRIPLKGMGTGSLPIMSAGLNIGITRRIW